jgi:hypothetical protein
MAMTVKCPCGGEAGLAQVDDLVPCPKCGKTLTIGTRPAPGAANKCPRCATPMDEGMTTCIICGYDMARSPNVFVETEQPRTSRLKIILLSVLAVLLIGGSLVGIFWPRAPREAPKPVESKGYLETVVGQPRKVKQQMTVYSAMECIKAFYALEGRYPKDLDELKGQDLAAPPPPTGMKYAYDPQTGNIALEPDAPGAVPAAP